MITTITESVRSAIRHKYEIPDNVEFIISEDVEEDYNYRGCSCCNPSSGYIQTTVFWEVLPKGRKRKVKNYRTYTGTVWELIQELEMP